MSKDKSVKSTNKSPTKRGRKPKPVGPAVPLDGVPITGDELADAARALDVQQVDRRLRRPMPAVDMAKPIEALRTLVRQHRAVTKTAVAILNFSRDKIALRDIHGVDGQLRYAKGATIPCSLPLPVMVGYREMVKQVTAPQLRKIEAEMAKALKQIPIYNEWLAGVFGLGPVITSYLVSEIDIRKCTKPSQLVRYCGFAVIDGRLERRKVGVRSSYNSELRTRIYQFFNGLWKQCSGRRTNKYMQIWLDGKNRKMSMATPAGKLDVRGKMVSAKGAAHNYGWHRAASIFIEDLYTVWRALEGLDVWPGYYAAKLGYEHGGKIIVNAPRQLSLAEAIALVGDVGAVRVEAPNEALDGPSTAPADGVDALDALAAEEEEEEEE